MSPFRSKKVRFLVLSVRTVLGKARQSVLCSTLFIQRVEALRFLDMILSQSHVKFARKSVIYPLKFIITMTCASLTYYDIPHGFTVSKTVISEYANWLIVLISILGEKSKIYHSGTVKRRELPKECCMGRDCLF